MDSIVETLGPGTAEYIVGAICSTHPIAQAEAVVIQEITEVHVPGDVQEQIMEIPMKHIIENIVEIPEVQAVERTADVPQAQVVTKTVEILQEEIVQVPRFGYQEENI